MTYPFVLFVLKNKIAVALVSLLAIVCLVLAVQLYGFRVFGMGPEGCRAKLEKQTARAEAAERELEFLADQSEQQIEQTARTIERVVVVEKEARKQADTIRAAPLPGDCKTPVEILGADL